MLEDYSLRPSFL